MLAFSGRGIIMVLAYRCHVACGKDDVLNMTAFSIAKNGSIVRL